MVEAITVVPVGVVVDVIASFFDNDTEKVLAFYEAAYDKLWGKSPEVDAILDGLADWIMVSRIDLDSEDFTAYVSGEEIGLP